MDVSRFRVGDWVLVVAGTAMLVLGLAVPWVTVSFRGQDLDGARTAFDYPFTGGIAWLLVVAAGVLTFLRAGRLIGDDSVPWTKLVVVGTTLAVILLGLRLALGAGDDSLAELGRGAGMVIAAIAAVGALGGAVLNLRAEGGSVRDVWSRRPATAPPPPPPGGGRRS